MGINRNPYAHARRKGAILIVCGFGLTLGSFLSITVFLDRLIWVCEQIHWTGLSLLVLPLGIAGLIIWSIGSCIWDDTAPGGKTSCPCPACGGSGSSGEYEDNPFGHLSGCGGATAIPCSVCHGSGKITLIE